MEGNEIIPYIEPIYRFCCRRLSQRYDAEDLASEIVCHVLDGMGKYRIASLDAWVWRIAHNRYAMFLEARNRDKTVLTEDETLCAMSDSRRLYVDEEETEQEFDTVFRYLHTLSAEYRNIFIDYYIGELSVRELSKKYSLSETTVKWRLNVGRRKIRERIGEQDMEKVYRRINWNTTCCNGSMDSDRYLHAQISRAICQAAYQKPLTVEEISVSTGIPALYIEDELPRLEYGDAVCRTSNKYAANFIIFSLQDRKDTEGVSGPMVQEIADRFEALLKNGAEAVRGMDFYGHDFGMERLGYILVPYLLRRKIGSLKSGGCTWRMGPSRPGRTEDTAGSSWRRRRTKTRTARNTVRDAMWRVMTAEAGMRSCRISITTGSASTLTQMSTMAGGRAGCVPGASSEQQRRCRGKGRPVRGGRRQPDPESSADKRGGWVSAEFRLLYGSAV